jgi:hypothetical protein
MFQQQSFGHFGAPDALSADYGNYGEHGDSDFTHDELIAMGIYPETSQTSVDRLGTSEQAPEELAMGSSYVRNNKPLPFIKNGAMDSNVERVTGIKGLVSEIQRRMGVAVTGQISDAQIRQYQTSQNISVDGVIGGETYTKLGFKPPYPKSSGGGSTYNPSTDTAIAKPKFYQQTWFHWTAIGLVAVATGLVLFYPRSEEE